MIKEMKIFKAHPNAEIPHFATEGASGMDLFASEPTIIKSGGYGLVKTGIKIQLPDNSEAQVRSRSGLANKKGVFVLNSPGTIDEDYRGEIGVILANLGKEDFLINVGDRIAQLVVAERYPVKIMVTENEEELSQTERGEGGFGSTGITNK